MSDKTSEPHLRRHRRSVAAAVLSVALLGTTALATAAEASEPLSGDTRATAVAGSISKCPAGQQTLLYDPNGTNGNALVGTNVTDGGRLVDLIFAASLNGSAVTAYIKGGKAYNVYDDIVAGGTTEDSDDLHAPLNQRGQIPAISHLLVCQTAAPPPPLINDPPKIHVAYVDSFHDPLASQSIPFTPSPWKGDPNVEYVGCNTDAECGKYDGGAIRIDNPATNTVTKTLNAASVTIGDCHFTPWGALLPRSFAPGKMLILTQSGILGPPMPGSCKEAIDPNWWDYTNFDTSERPGDNRGAPDGSGRVYNCDATTGHTPLIHLEFADGTVLDINDTQKILNTGGTDSHACNTGNEASPWVEILY